MALAMSDLPSFLEHLAAAARAVTLGAPVPEAENKQQGGAFDPVTELDRQAEQVLRAAIEQRFPDDGIEGEEFGVVRSEASRRWLLDPIDGTRALICGLPSWATLVALVDDGQPTHSMIDCPPLGELHLASPNGAWMNGTVLRTSGCSVLAQARLSTTDPYLFAGKDAEAFARVRHSSKVTRYGLDALAYARLAAGHLDLVIENGLKTHDWAALVPVVRGAGGWIGNWNGGDDLASGAVVAASTRRLFDQAVACLNP